jgi:hypothetical protein
MREEGFYWVKYKKETWNKNFADEERWTVAEFHGSWRTNNDYGTETWPDEYFESIDERRIRNPSESTFGLNSHSLDRVWEPEN